MTPAVVGWIASAAVFATLTYVLGYLAGRESAESRAELDRLRRLWAGAPAGSLPPVAPTQVSPASPSAGR